MKLSQLLYLISTIAKEKGLSEVFIVGGVPRDKVLNKLNELKDIDLTTGDESIHYLAKEISIQFQSPKTKYEVMPDNHARVFLGDLKLDFSSNFRIPNIENILKSKGINNPSSMLQEIYSRDFTCNTLLLSMDLKTIQDPTGLALKDIKSKILKTCLEPNITLGLDNRRVVRVLYLAAKLNFEIDSEIIAWIKKNPSTFANLRPKSLNKKLREALEYDKERVLELIDLMELWKYVPPLPELIPYMSKNIKRL